MAIRHPRQADGFPNDKGAGKPRFPERAEADYFRNTTVSPSLVRRRVSSISWCFLQLTIASGAALCREDARDQPRWKSRDCSQRFPVFQSQTDKLPPLAARKEKAAIPKWGRMRSTFKLLIGLQKALHDRKQRSCSAMPSGKFCELLLSLGTQVGFKLRQQCLNAFDPSTTTFDRREQTFAQEPCGKVLQFLARAVTMTTFAITAFADYCADFLKMPKTLTGGAFADLQAHGYLLHGQVY